MKQFLSGLMLTFLIAFTANTVQACKIIPQGYCGEVQWYKTKDFNKNSIYYIRNLAGDTLLTLTSGNIAPVDSLFTLPVMPNVPVFLKYRYIDSTTWVGWNCQAHSLTTEYDNCGGILAVAITNVVAKRNNTGGINVSFRSEDENQVMKYQLLTTTNNKDYDVILGTIDPSGKVDYSIEVPKEVQKNQNKGTATATIGFFIMMLYGAKVNRNQAKSKNKTSNKHLALIGLLAITFIFVSCSKEKKVEPEIDLQKVESIIVVAVQTTGVQTLSTVAYVR